MAEQSAIDERTNRHPADLMAALRASLERQVKGQGEFADVVDMEPANKLPDVTP